MEGPKNAVSKKTTSGAFFRTICEVWCFCICFLEFPGCFGYSLGLGALARKFVHFCESSCIFWHLGLFFGCFGVSVPVCAKKQKRTSSKHRATSSNVEQRRANVEQTSSNVEQRRANVEQRRATSSNVKQTSSNVEQRRATSRNAKEAKKKRKCQKVHIDAQMCTILRASASKPSEYRNRAQKF